MFEGQEARESLAQFRDEKNDVSGMCGEGGPE